MSHPNKRFLPWVVGVVGAAFALLGTGCVAPPVMTTKLARFPLMYEEKPACILVLPPINHTTAADAKLYYSTTVAGPLALQGFYVLPMEVTSEILKSQGVYDTETLVGQPTAKFKQYFGADAVLYTEITRWSTSYAVVSASLTVAFNATLKSTHTERVLWQYSGTIDVDLTGHSSSGNLVADLIAGAVTTAIAAAATDYVPFAMLANGQILHTIPVGKYHPEYLTDQNVTFQDHGALPVSPPPAAAASTAPPAPTEPQKANPAAAAVSAAAPEPQIEHLKLKNRLGLEVAVEGDRILVKNVLSDSAAAQAGIKRDDQILKYNGVPDGLTDSAQLKTIASAINDPLQHAATVTWRSSSGAEKTQALDW